MSPAAVARLHRLAPLAMALVLVGACSSGPSGGDALSGTESVVPTTEVPPPQARVVGEQVVDPSFRQGVAKAATGWVFSGNLALFATDDALTITRRNPLAIPAEWAAQGFNHIGDIDVAGGIVYAPIEQPDYGKNRQAMFRYDATTLAFIDGVAIAQSENSWVAVDADAQIAYSMNAFSDHAVTRFDLSAGWKPLDPIALDTTLNNVQGGDVRDGYLWLSTDDATDEVYRVDLGSGHVVALGSVGHVDGEAEGIDATVLPRGDLHVLSTDVAGVPVRLIDLAVR